MGILAFAGVRIEVSHAQATLLVSVFSLTAITATLLATIHYKVDATYLHLNIAFIDMLGNRIKIDNILNIVIDDGKLFISYLWKGPDPVIALISINPKKYDKFRELLMSRNKNIIFYENKDEGTTDCQQ